MARTPLSIISSERDSCSASRTKGSSHGAHALKPRLPSRMKNSSRCEDDGHAEFGEHGERDAVRRERRRGLGLVSRGVTKAVPSAWRCCRGDAAVVEPWWVGFRATACVFTLRLCPVKVDDVSVIWKAGQVHSVCHRAQFRQLGLVSSHFFRRPLHVKHPLFARLFCGRRCC